MQDLVLHGVLEDAVGVLHDDDLVIDGVQDQYHEVAVEVLDRHDSRIVGIVPIGAVLKGVVIDRVSYWAR